MDEIISTVSHKGVVYIFTKCGQIFQMEKDDLTDRIEIRLEFKLNLLVK